MEVSEDIKKFVHDDVFGNSEYLFVSKVGNKHSGYCTYCNHGLEIKKVVAHNDWTICPICGAHLQIKLTRYGRKICKNEACFYYFEKSIVDSNVIVCKGYYVSKDYSKDYMEPEFEYSLYAIYIFQDKKAVMLTKNWWYQNWDKRATIYDFNQGWLAPKMCYYSPESLRKAIQGTSFQYMPLELFEGHFSLVKLLMEYAKHPWIEQICKIGFEGIIEEKLKRNCLYDCLNYKGKNVFKILRLNRKEVKEIKQSNVNITPLFLRMYQLQSKDNCGFSPEQVKGIESTYGYYYCTIRKATKYTSMKKAIKYIDKQHEKTKEKYYYSKSDFAVNWSDYIDDCVRLGMNLKDESVLFPKDVYAAHQNTIKQVKLKADEMLNNKIKNRLKILEKYYFEYNGLIIRPALSSNELIEEGKALNHCVGTYADRYAEGKTNIFVIRKLSNPDKPYYTMEVADNRIKQTRGKNNCAPTEDVKEFIEAFTKAKLEKKLKVKIPA